jgi:hypothetical protein
MLLVVEIEACNVCHFKQDARKQMKGTMRQETQVNLGNFFQFMQTIVSTFCVLFMNERHETLQIYASQKINFQFKSTKTKTFLFSFFPSCSLITNKLLTKKN